MQNEPKSNSGASAADASQVARDKLLQRVKRVARQIEDRIRSVTGDTGLDHAALPTEDTREHPRLPG